MGNILLVSEDNNVIEKYKKLFDNKYHTFGNCCTETTLFDKIETDPADVFIFDANVSFQNLTLILKKVKSILENAIIFLLTDDVEIDEEISKSVNSYILKSYSDKLIYLTVNSALKTKENIDRLSVRNSDMAESLYRLNVLYNTSSQFAGTLDIKELLSYMNEGLDRSLSFDLNYILSFGFENEPILIINSLYDVSEELIEALKVRAVSNYKSIFENKNIPYETDEKNLKVIKKVKNPNEKHPFTIFEYDNLFAPIDLGEQFFGCIEIFKKKSFTTDDAAYFQTIIRQVSLPLKSACLYNKISEKNKELEKLEQVKSDFISIVSHELRTPLTPIKNALSILSGGRCGDMSENATKFIDMAKRNVNNLTHIINDILDINKIEAGKMVFNYKTMNIHSVIENVKNNFDCVAREHEIIFDTIEQPDLPEIYADSQRLEQILTNLVSNAIKFTPCGKHITIKSELKNSSDIISANSYFENELKTLNGDYIVVSVMDEGIGIKPENLVRAFDMFTQIENSLTRKVGGTGLGLPIAKQLIKAHKGVIWCDSEEEKGSNFHFAIPVIKETIQAKILQKELV